MVVYVCAGKHVPATVSLGYGISGMHGLSICYLSFYLLLPVAL